MRGRLHPADLTDLTEKDVQAQVEQIAQDCERAGRLARGAPGWAWLVRLAAMFPQSPPVHPSRHTNPAPIGERVRNLLAPDPGPSPTRGRGRPCWSCGTENVTVRWGKDRWPLTEAQRYLNTTAYRGGHPSCRRCRIAVWSLPYALAPAGRLLQSVHALGPHTTRALATAHLALTRRALDEEWTTWRQAPHADDLLWEVIAGPHGSSNYQILRWTSANRQAELSSRYLSPQASSLLAAAYQQGAAEDLRRAARQTLAATPSTWPPTTNS